MALPLHGALYTSVHATRQPTVDAARTIARRHAAGRHYVEIRRLLERAKLAGNVKARTLAIFEALGTAYPLVTEPGADVLRIRVAITDIVTSNPAVSGITTVLPVGLAVSVGKKAAGGSYSGVGGASMEVEFLDSMADERLAAAIDTFNGSKMSGFSKLGATKDAFEFWANRLRVTLDKAHGVSN